MSLLTEKVKILQESHVEMQATLHRVLEILENGIRAGEDEGRNSLRERSPIRHSSPVRQGAKIGEDELGRGKGTDDSREPSRSA